MENVTLTKIEEKDIETVRLWRNLPEVAKYLYSDADITQDQQLQWYQKIKTDISCCYWIINYKNQPVGLASIYNISEFFSSCYWAFYLGNTSIRGVGIGAFVEYKIIEYVFNELKLNKLRCEVFAFNTAVIHKHEQFGFRREAYYRQHIKKNGKYEDVIGLALLKSEWLTLKESIYRNFLNRNQSTQ